MWYSYKNNCGKVKARNHYHSHQIYQHNLNRNSRPHQKHSAETAGYEKVFIQKRKSLKRKKNVTIWRQDRLGDKLRWHLSPCPAPTRPGTPQIPGVHSFGLAPFVANST